MPPDLIQSINLKEVNGLDNRWTGEDLGSDVQDTIQASIKHIEGALDEFGVEGLSISFNGGKDCTVLLHLFWNVLKRRGINPRESLIKAIYVAPKTAFPQVEDFVQRSVVRYNLWIDRIEGGMKDGLKAYLERHPDIKAILIGVRSTDPYSSKLVPRQPTDSGWPAFTRIQPILDWDYRLVWRYLRELNVEFCSLYADGYTSLGSVENTKPNPALQISDKDANDEITKFKPAWELEDESLERYGRT